MFVYASRIPEMYELSGPPFRVDPNDTSCVVDRRGERIHLMGASRAILTELANDIKWQDTKVRGLGRQHSSSHADGMALSSPHPRSARVGGIRFEDRVSPVGKQLSQGMNI